MKMSLNFISIPQGHSAEVAPPFRTLVRSNETFEVWRKRNKFNDFFATVYSFRNPYDYNTALVDKVFWDVDKFAGEALRLLNYYYSEYERVFVATGNNFHLYVAIEPLKEHKKPSLRNHINEVEKETGIKCDPATRGNLAQMGRVPGSINTKNGARCMFFNPLEWTYSTTPVVLKGKVLRLEVVEEFVDERWLSVRKELSSKAIIDFDDDNLLELLKTKIELPPDPGHFSRMEVLRKLRSEGVPPTVARKFMHWWLPPHKIKAMEQEKMLERIYMGKL